MTLSSCCSILKAKAQGLLEGLQASKFFGVSSLVIEGDNLVVISSLRHCWKVLWETRSFTLDAVVELQQF